MVLTIEARPYSNFSTKYLYRKQRYMINVVIGTPSLSTGFSQKKFLLFLHRTSLHNASSLPASRQQNIHNSLNAFNSNDFRPMWESVFLD